MSHISRELVVQCTCQQDDTLIVPLAWATVEYWKENVLSS